MDKTLLHRAAHSWAPQSPLSEWQLHCRVRAAPKPIPHIANSSGLQPTCTMACEPTATQLHMCSGHGLHPLQLSSNAPVSVKIAQALQTTRYQTINIPRNKHAWNRDSQPRFSYFLNLFLLLHLSPCFLSEPLGKPVLRVLLHTLS